MTDELDHQKTGPISKYNPSVCSQVLEAAKTGAHIPGMMLAIGIRSKDTWYRWQDEHPEFKEAVEYAKVISQAVWENIGLQGTTGNIKNFNASSYALIMNNKFSDEYRRSGTGSNTDITINQLSLTPEQVQQRITQVTERLKALGQEIDDAVYTITD